jgi:hypothetical protein
MSDRPLWDITTTGADEKVAAGAAARIVRRMIMVLLLTAAALDLTRYGLVMTAARHPAPTAGLVAAGLAAVIYRADRARMPGRPALGRLDRIAHRRRVDPASGRVRLP